MRNIEKRLFHVGISVPDIDIAVSFFERIFNFKLVQNRRIEGPYLWSLVGESNVTAEVRMLQMDSDTFLEILCWTNSDFSQSLSHLQNTRITSVGAQHICVYSNNATQTFEQLKVEVGVEFISDQVTEVLSGPNLGAKVFFVRLFGFLFLEVFQRPA